MAKKSAPAPSPLTFDLPVSLLAKIEVQRKALKKEQDEKFRVITSAFRRALRLADFRTPEGRKDDARYFLAYMYLLAGDPFRAAVLGEYLARRDPPTKRSPP